MSEDKKRPIILKLRTPVKAVLTERKLEPNVQGAPKKGIAPTRYERNETFDSEIKKEEGVKEDLKKYENKPSSSHKLDENRMGFPKIIERTPFKKPFNQDRNRPGFQRRNPSSENRFQGGRAHGDSVGGGNRPYNKAPGNRPYNKTPGSRPPYQNRFPNSPNRDQGSNERNPFVQRSYGPRNFSARPAQGGKPSGPLGAQNSFPNPLSKSGPRAPIKSIMGIEKDDRRRKNFEKERVPTKLVKGSSKETGIDNFSTFVGRVDESSLEINERFKSFASERRFKERAKRRERGSFIVRDVQISGPIELKALANKMAIKIEDLFHLASKVGINLKEEELIDEDTAHILVEEFGHKAIRVDEEDKSKLEFQLEEAKEESNEPRPPVVVVVGHVDHGKTSLLDAIRKTNVTKGEAGGITQHIGAYQVKLKGQDITFLDTPGHEAFTAMRARGVMATDIAILVVAADEGPKPQTEEAIKHVKLAKIPMIVAITKCDKYEADIQKVTQDLLKYEVVAESYGGDIPIVEVSSVSGKNIEKLLETILLQAEILDIRASKKIEARGVVLESKMDPKRGPLATLLVQNGVLKKSMMCVAGVAFGKIKAMRNDKGELIDSALPGMPIEVIGFDVPPEAGELFAFIKNEKQAVELVKARKNKQSEQKLDHSASVFSLFKDDKQEMNLILRADTQGSLEALELGVSKIQKEGVDIKVILSGIGAPKESDIDLAVVTKSQILGFNVQPPSALKIKAESKNINIIQHRVIYHMLEEIEKQIKGMTEPKEKEVILGTSKIKEIFAVSKIGNVAGSIVLDGMMKRGAKARLVRNGSIVYESSISSLKRLKDDVREVNSGLECGIMMDKFNDYSVGDEIVCYNMEAVNLD